MSSFNKEYKKILVEMPSLVPASGKQIMDDRLGNYEEAQKIKKEYKVVDTFDFLDGKIELYIQSYTNSSEKELHSWIWGEYVAAEFVLEKLEDGVVFRGAWNAINQRGLARLLMFGYYLKKYAFIQSDNTHTPRGRAYWENLVSKADPNKIFWVSKNEVKPLKIEQLEDMWGKDKEHYDITIRIYP